ncbi:MAG: AAA family ATPase [Nanoarchaeota archaeon]
MAEIIILRGPLGVGKTTIGQLLAKKLNGVVIEYDTVLSQNKLDTIPPKERCIPLTNFLKADKIVIPCIKLALASGKTVILVGCFYHAQHITHLQKAFGRKIQVLTLTAPLKTCIRRDSRRKKPYGKEAAKAVYSLVKGQGTLIDARLPKRKIIKTINAKISKSQ